MSKDYQTNICHIFPVTLHQNSVPENSTVVHDLRVLSFIGKTERWGNLLCALHLGFSIAIAEARKLEALVALSHRMAPGPPSRCSLFRGDGEVMMAEAAQRWQGIVGVGVGRTPGLGSHQHSLGLALLPLSPVSPHCVVHLLSAHAFWKSPRLPNGLPLSPVLCDLT